MNYKHYNIIYKFQMPHMPYEDQIKLSTEFKNNLIKIFHKNNIIIYILDIYSTSDYFYINFKFDLNINEKITKGPNIYNKVAIDNFKKSKNEGDFFIQNDILYFKEEINIVNLIKTIIYSVHKSIQWSISMRLTTEIISSSRPIIAAFLSINNNFETIPELNILNWVDFNTTYINYSDVEQKLIKILNNLSNQNINLVYQNEYITNSIENEVKYRILFKKIIQSNYTEFILIPIEKKYTIISKKILLAYLDHHLDSILMEETEMYALFFNSQVKNSSEALYKKSLNARLFDLLFMFTLDTDYNNPDKTKIQKYYLMKSQEVMYNNNYTILQKSNNVLNIAYQIIDILNIQVNKTILDKLAQIYLLDLTSYIVSENHSLLFEITKIVFYEYNKYLTDFQNIHFTDYQYNESYILYIAHIIDDINNLTLEHNVSSSSDPFGVKRLIKKLASVILKYNIYNVSTLLQDNKLLNKYIIQSLKEKNPIFDKLNIKNIQHMINWTIVDSSYLLKIIHRADNLIIKSNPTHNVELDAYENSLLNELNFAIENNTLFNDLEKIEYYLDNYQISQYFSRVEILQKFISFYK